MALRQKAAADSGSFEPAPEGTHRAVCTRVIDQGTQPSNFGPKRKLLLGFELEETRGDGSRFMAFQNATLSTHPKSRLRGLLERWRGRRYDDGDEINIAALVGNFCQFFFQELFNGQTIGGTLIHVTISKLTHIDACWRQFHVL